MKTLFAAGCDHLVRVTADGVKPIGYVPLSTYYWLKDLAWPNSCTPGLYTFLNPSILKKP